MLIVYWWRLRLYMSFILDKFRILWVVIRGYSLPISIMSWTVPFFLALTKNGNFLYGIIALIGIILLHAGVNVFDDIVDYSREKLAIDKGLKENFNFQKGKCACIFDGSVTFKNYCIISFFLFFIPLLIAIFFFNVYGFELLPIVIPTMLLCLLYPILGCLGLGELIVAIVFSPLMYLGVFYVMTGIYSIDVLLISISTGLLSVAVLHNHMLLDFKFDEQNRKITLCRFCKTEKRALLLLGSIILFAYLNIIFGVLFSFLSPLYLITFFSIPTAITLYKVMTIHIENPNTEVKTNIFMGNTSEIKKAPDEQKSFLIKFIIVRNLLSIFTLLICISIVLDKII